jgi:hypothetical protein
MHARPPKREIKLTLPSPDPLADVTCFARISRLPLTTTYLHKTCLSPQASGDRYIVIGPGYLRRYYDGYALLSAMLPLLDVCRG